MPVGNPPFQTPRGDRVDDEAAEKWSTPLGSIAGTRLSLSYGVFFAAAILVAVVLIVSTRSGDRDLPRAAAIGTAFWLTGWIAQLLVHLVMPRVLGIRLTRMNVGLVGVESAPRRWSASSTLLVSVSSILSLLLLGCFFRLVEGGFQMPVFSRDPSPPWAAPSIGFASHDSVWRSAAWLCWVQAVFQLYPLPRTMGRQIFGSLARICGRRLDLTMQAVIFRRCLTAVAMMTVVVALFAMSVQASPATAQWPLLLLLGALLWASSRTNDVTDILAAIESSEQNSPSSDKLAADHAGGQASAGGVVSRIRRSIRSRQVRKRLQRSMDRERSEAVDAERLDDILNRLHRDGVDSLDEEDRKILERVSENLRKQRQVDADESS